MKLYKIVNQHGDVLYSGLTYREAKDKVKELKFQANQKRNYTIEYKVI